MTAFFQLLHTQRMDDHRFYHQSRINQSLHFVSAISFLVSYVFLFLDPAWAALIAWGFSMPSRQAGHFFFEPKGFDHVNQATHEHKEEIKVGYNIKRKLVLLAVWAASPLLLVLDPTLLGAFTPHTDWTGFVTHVGELWLVVGLAGIAFRALQLFLTKDLRTGLVWVTKIATDPFHDIMLYHKAPLALLRGELIDPGIGQHNRDEDEEEEMFAETEPRGA